MTYPDDILLAAKRHAYATEATGDDRAAVTSFIGVRVICGAILAERQRCAKIAAGGLQKDGSFIATGAEAEAIADAILSGESA